MDNTAPRQPVILANINKLHFTIIDSRPKFEVFTAVTVKNRSYCLLEFVDFYSDRFVTDASGELNSNLQSR
jgi:hypothetical protein